MEYQHGFSKLYGDGMYDVERRQQKAKKMIAVLSDYYDNKIEELDVLDMGCSTGIISEYLNRHVGSVIGIDIDKGAIDYANKNFKSDTLRFQLQDGLTFDMPDNHVDVVICAQIYEHVPDPHKLVAEIYRVLKPGGVCYFAAGNRFMFMEPHHKLPFLAALPKPLGHLYLRMMGKGQYYYESHYSYWGLRKLTNDFDLIDYTKKIIRDPEKFCCTEMVKAGSVKQKFALLMLTMAYFLFPAYIWLLKKRAE